MKEDFISTYMRMCDLENSEAPAIYHRWCCLSIMGAYIGRQCWVNFGIGNIYPNQYIMLMGEPGTRKGSAMGVARKLLKKTGYTRFSKDKTSKERFLVDMKQYDTTDESLEDLEMLSMDSPSESYIMAGEFTDFIGQGNMDFVTFLTNVWDNLDKYEHPKLHGKSVEVYKPTVNLLGGNTPEGFALAFPPEALGNGFLSRVILLHAEPTSVRVAWPEPPDELLMADLANRMIFAKKTLAGEIVVTTEAKKIASEIYKKEIPVDDARFKHYQQRRYIHMLKIALLLAVYDARGQIQPIDMVRANTVLAVAERHMGKALGEFGASRYSGVAGKILSHLAGSVLPQDSTDLWKVCARDLTKRTELSDILLGLQTAEKIQVKSIGRKTGYLLLHKQKKEWPADLLDLQWLTEEEQLI